MRRSKALGLVIYGSVWMRNSWYYWHGDGAMSYGILNGPQKVVEDGRTASYPRPLFADRDEYHKLWDTPHATNNMNYGSYRTLTS